MSEQYGSWALDFLRLNCSFFPKLGEKQAFELGEKAIKYGADKAREFAEQYPELSHDGISLALQRRKVRLIRNTKSTICPFLSDFNPAQRTMTLYVPNIEKFYQQIAVRFSECFQNHSLEEMCIYHELCHVIEFDEKNSIGNLFCGISQNGFIKRKLKIRALSEIAAHAFVQELLNLPLSPGEFGFPPRAPVCSDALTVE